jgi:hypothetical protein
MAYRSYHYSRNRPVGRAIFVIAAILAAIIVLHIVFVLIGANPGNTLVATDADWAGTLGSWFNGLFTPSDYKLAVLLDYGLAALFYLVLGRLAEKAVDAV